MRQIDWARPNTRALFLVVAVSALAACKEDGSALIDLDGSTSSSASVRGREANSTPLISGTPNLQTQIGSFYSFKPFARDPDGDRIGFSIRNKPSWATFDPNNGELSGTPGESDVGLASGIVISASDGNTGSALPPFSIRVVKDGNSGGSSGGDTPPQMSGQPTSFAAIDRLYFFQPQASDPDGDQLTFTMLNKPAWMDFDTASGTISGIPNTRHIGNYSDLYIIASDGVFEASLGPFSVEVVPAGDHSTTLSWLPPVSNEDGSPLVDLSGYRVRYGVEQGFYSNLIDLSNPGLTLFVVDGLVPDTYYFVISAYNSQGIESNFSNEGIVTIN